MRLFLLLGHKVHNDAEKLLTNILESHSLTAVNCVPNGDSMFHYCYKSKPDAKERLRENIRAFRMQQIREQIKQEQFVMIGFGWMAIDMLFRVSKTKTHTRIGAKWFLVPGGEMEAWATYDPSAALFDPNLVVDIAWVVVNAAYDAGLSPEPNIKIPPFNWDKYI